MPTGEALRGVLARLGDEVLDDWIGHQRSLASGRPDLIREEELRRQSGEFLALLRNAVAAGDLENLDGEQWSAVQDFLAGIARSRAMHGFTPTETAAFIFSLKQSLFTCLRDELTGDPGALADELWVMMSLMDRLALCAIDVLQRSREEVIARQHEELLELSTPVVQLWEKILALPIIGTLDSERTQRVMESLLQKIVETRAEVAIIDITGVPMVDTVVAQHLLKTVAAARLMGADCIISGIRPQIAQTIVHLGVRLSEVTTKATLADAFAVALRRIQGAPPGAATGS